MVNAVVIVNDELVFRFPLTERACTLQQYEATLLAAIGPLLPVPIPQVEMQIEQWLSRSCRGSP